MNAPQRFPKQFSHILQHMVQIFRDCDCPIIHYPNGDVETRNPNSYDDPAVASHLGALRAMEAAGLIVNMEDQNDSVMYCPTVSGLQYLEWVNRPLKVWLKNNWFAVTVLSVTTVVNVRALLLK